jgi:hypothetical protein
MYVAEKMYQTFIKIRTTPFSTAPHDSARDSKSNAFIIELTLFQVNHIFSRRKVLPSPSAPIFDGYICAESTGEEVRVSFTHVVVRLNARPI